VPRCRRCSERCLLLPVHGGHLHHLVLLSQDALLGNHCDHLLLLRLLQRGERGGRRRPGGACAGRCPHSRLQRCHLLMHLSRLPLLQEGRLLLRRERHGAGGRARRPARRGCCSRCSRLLLPRQRLHEGLVLKQRNGVLLLLLRCLVRHHRSLLRRGQTGQQGSHA
jgi:hypothetical protein